MNRERALEFLTRLAEAVASTFGADCETVVQELQDGKIVTLAIFNGHVSGRKLPTATGILGGTLDDETAASGAGTDVVNQLVLHPSGKKIKTTTVAMHGDDYTLLFGINCDITAASQMQDMLSSFLTFHGELSSTMIALGGKQQSLQSIYEKCHAELNLPERCKLDITDRQNLLLLLNSCGFFSMQKSIPFLAEKLGVSKYTLYKDLGKLNIK